MTNYDIIGLIGGLFIAVLMAYAVYRMTKADFGKAHK